MSIYGIGVDLVNIERVRKLWDEGGENFAKRILSETELSNLNSIKDPALYIAKCFAIKEAVAKALGVGFREDVFLTNISYVKNELGKPSVEYHGKTMEFVKGKRISATHISLTDEPPQVVAYAITETLN